MYSTLFLVHKYSVLLFLLIYLTKTALLLLNKNELLTKVTKAIKIPEMIVSFSFLASGIYLAVNNPLLGTLFWIKLVCVFVSIPLAVVGFKKGNKILAALSFVLIVGSYGLSEVHKASLKKAYKADPIDMSSENTILLGLTVYQKQCMVCHGENGDAGLAGAANLKNCVLNETQISEILSKGKGSMPKFNYLSESEVKAVTAYIGTLKN
ncbi:MAG: cytochrome c [Bacteroidetes bacterium]|nr:MAG: cytochrome c [Bacteroidota bacterium]